MRDFSLYLAFSSTFMNLRQQKWRRCFQKWSQPWKFNEAYVYAVINISPKKWRGVLEAFRKDLTTGSVEWWKHPQMKLVGYFLFLLRKLLEKYAPCGRSCDWPSDEAHFWAINSSSVRGLRVWAWFISLWICMFGYLLRGPIGPKTFCTSTPKFE